jgi:hypothetical protein
MSYGFPIIIFCNPGVHYETPCIDIDVDVDTDIDVDIDLPIRL